MLPLLVSCVALCFAGPADALEIVEPRGTYGHLGAVRPKDGILPGDVAFFTFGVKNLQFDDKGQAKYSIGIEVRDANGELFFEQKPYNVVSQNYLGGSVIPCSAHIEIPLDAKPGALHWKVTVEDRESKKTAVLEGKGKILPAGFGIVRVGTFADPEGKVPVAPVGVVGETLFINFGAVGFMRSDKTKQPDLVVELRVRDEKGALTFAKPLSGQVNDKVPASTRVLPMQFGVTLNRPGRYTVELTSRCNLCNATTSVTLPIRVLPME
jgi:hypothetical protein